MSKFGQLFKNIVNNLQVVNDTVGELYSMTTQQFSQYLQTLVPMFEQYDVDLSNVTYQQEVTTYPYSWLTTQKFSPLFNQDINTELNKNVKSVINDIIADGQQFKLIGKVIDVQRMVNTDAISQIGQEYVTENFVEVGGFMVLTIKRVIDDQQLENVDQQLYDDIICCLKKLNNNRFKFYSRKWNVRLTISPIITVEDITNLKQEHVNRNQKLLLTLRDYITTQMNQLVTEFNQKMWDTDSNINTKYQLMLDQLYDQFLSNVFNTTNILKIASESQKYNTNKFVKLYDQYYGDFINQYGKITNQIKSDNTIPLGERYRLYFITKKNLQTLSQFSDLKGFLKGLND